MLRKHLLKTWRKNRSSRRIVHCIPFFDYLSGYEEDLSVRYAAEAGYDAIVVTSMYSIKKAGRNLGSRLHFIFKQQVGGITIYRLPAIILPSGATTILGSTFLIMLLMPDIIHIHGIASPNGWLNALVGKFIGARVLSDSHDYVYSTHQLANPGKSLYNKLRYLEFKLLRRKIGQMQLAASDSVICYENKTERFLRDFYAFKGIVQNIYIGYEEKYFYYTARQTTSSQKVIGFVGQASERKRLESLLYILDKVGKDYRLLIVGNWDLKYKRKFLDLATDLRLEDRLILKENVPYEQVGIEIRKMIVAIYLYSSSIACNQILGCGVPLIMAIGQQFESAARSYGFVVEEETSEALEEKCASLIVNKLEGLYNYATVENERFLSIQTRLSFGQTFSAMERLYGES